MESSCRLVATDHNNIEVMISLCYLMEKPVTMKQYQLPVRKWVCRARVIAYWWSLILGYCLSHQRSSRSYWNTVKSGDSGDDGHWWEKVGTHNYCDRKRWNNFSDISPSVGKLPLNFAFKKDEDYQTHNSHFLKNSSFLPCCHSVQSTRTQPTQSNHLL